MLSNWLVYYDSGDGEVPVEFDDSLASTGRASGD